MVGVPVPLVVHRDDVHQHDVLRVLVHPGERDPDGGEHPPNEEETLILVVNVLLLLIILLLIIMML